MASYKKSAIKVIWEVAVRVYDDNDGSKEHEHFIGSTDIKSVNGDKNLGYITADVFQKLTLIK
jgi:hypothetical protein